MCVVGVKQLKKRTVRSKVEREVWGKKQRATARRQRVERRWKADGGGNARGGTRLLSDARTAKFAAGPFGTGRDGDSIFQTGERLSIHGNVNFRCFGEISMNRIGVLIIVRAVEPVRKLRTTHPGATRHPSC